MPSDLPQTPQSPFNSPGSTDTHSKNTVSPRINTSLPTPAHSINGSMSTINSATEAPQSEDPSNKRKRDIEDLGDRDQKKVHVENSRPDINDLHQDVGKKYLLCRTRHTREKLNMKSDLFDRFGLNEIASTLARVTADGKKNTIRKTYKGYIKTLGVAGQFDAVKGDIHDPNSLWSLVNDENGSSVADREGFEETMDQGIEIDRGIPDYLRASLSNAVIMAKGPIPKDRWNPSVLGEMGNQIANDPVKAAPAKARVPMSQGTIGVPKQNRNGADLVRPKRTVKKRSYGDASYEGYGEGYVDDDTGYSTGDGDDRAGGRKRPKKTPTSHGFQGPMRQSYGPGMVGA